jgi:hypothetical protein
LPDRRGYCSDADRIRSGNLNYPRCSEIDEKRRSAAVMLSWREIESELKD